MNGEYEVSKETWEKLDVDEKLWMIFDTMNERHKVNNRRFRKLEKSKKFNSMLSAIGGFFGGAVAIVTKGLLKW